jgi:RHS repeat-associated protein
MTRAPGGNGLAAQIFKTSATVQDLHYTYDPAGNITEIADAALQTVFNGQQVEPACNYTYDPLYRLIEATGREHIGQSAFAPPDGNFRDYPFVGPSAQNDLQRLRTYTERYDYDPAGNFKTMFHLAGNGAGNWTRGYSYNESSLIEPVKKSNRLSQTALQTSGNPPVEPYSYDAHGNIVRMPHLPMMQWDFRDQLSATSQRVVNVGTPETTFYVYDGGGQRAQKITERQNGLRKNERFYLGGFEVYREFGAGGAVALERETLHVMDDKQRIALIETRTMDNGSEVASPMPAQRYQLGNHLGSASLELDAAGRLISYEEYSPYGNTSYQARGAAEVSLKRYRYTGKERDEENGFTYHGARYYAPWLGRWTACDPTGLADGTNLYAYVSGNPVMLNDPSGRAEEPQVLAAISKRRLPAAASNSH